MVQLPSGLMRITPFGNSGTPCEHPAPASTAYIVSPMKAMSATPLTSLPESSSVWLDGRFSATVVSKPPGPIFRMREPVGLPEYGPTLRGSTQQFG